MTTNILARHPEDRQAQTKHPPPPATAGLAGVELDEWLPLGGDTWVVAGAIVAVTPGPDDGTSRVSLSGAGPFLANVAPRQVLAMVAASLKATQARVLAERAEQAGRDLERQEVEA